MELPSLQTAVYQNDARARPEPERLYVALVAGSARTQSNELYPLLRRRLLIYTTIVSVAFLVSKALAVLSLSYGMLAGQLQTPSDWLNWWGSTWRTSLSLLVAAAGALVLWLRAPRSVSGLRTLELTILGMLVVFCLELSVSEKTYGLLLAADSMPEETRMAFVERYGLSGSLLWFILLITYGALIPNTWRRSAIVCGVVGLSPLVLFLLYGLVIRPLPAQMVVDVFLTLGFYIALAVAIVVFATSRIEHYRRQAAETRKLGQYVLKEKLGAGGMGEVYRAEHLLLRRPCALKLIHPRKAGDPETLRRFEREVQITATLTHPNTVQVFDYGHAEDGTFYYVMEYLPGLTLEEMVRRHGPLPPGRVIHLLRQMCAALSEAHGRGLTHRDIKPGNVMICERGGICDVAKVLDFGLVRVPTEEADDGKLTREGTVTGTPAYMSPEQAGGQEGIDPRSDIYSVGALAYFLLTGKPPFDGRSTVRMMAAHLYEAPVPLPEEVPSDLATTVLKCLAKSPADRWADAQSLETALASVGDATWSARDALTWWEQTRGAEPVPSAVLAAAR